MENDELLRKYAKDRVEVYGAEAQANDDASDTAKEETACAAKVKTKVVTPDSDAVRDNDYWEDLNMRHPVEKMAAHASYDVNALSGETTSATAPDWACTALAKDSKSVPRLEKRKGHVQSGKVRKPEKKREFLVEPKKIEVEAKAEVPPCLPCGLDEASSEAFDVGEKEHVRLVNPGKRIYTIGHSDHEIGEFIRCSKKSM